MITESWRRIDAWLAAHAPGSLALLNPGASAERIRALEELFEVPGQLRESLAVHDGVSEPANLLPEGDPLSVADIAAHWRMCAGIEAEPPVSGEPWWHPDWIPWARSEGVAQVIDMRPGRRQGRLGIAGHGDGGAFGDGWPCLAAYLEDVADALWDGTPAGPWHAYVTDDGMLWWSPDDDEADDDESLRHAPPWGG